MVLDFTKPLQRKGAKQKVVKAKYGTPGNTWKVVFEDGTRASYTKEGIWHIGRIEEGLDLEYVKEVKNG